MGDYPRFELEAGYVVLTIDVEMNTPQIHAHAIMRRLDTARQKVGTLGSYTFTEDGTYEGLGDCSGEPGPKCPQELLNGMKQLNEMFQQHWS